MTDPALETIGEEAARTGKLPKAKRHVLLRLLGISWWGWIKLALLCVLVGFLVMASEFDPAAPDVNVIGALNAARASRERMGKDSAMVLFSSVAAQKGFQNHTAIASAKGALEALTRQLAAEYAPKTRVNAIALSLTDTPLASSVLKSDAMRDGIAKSHALQRLGQPEDPAALARFLLSDESSWMTGTILNVDGGRTALA